MAGFEIVTPDGIDDLNSYLSGTQAKIDADSMNQLESLLKTDKNFDQSRMAYGLKVAQEYLERQKYSGTT